MAEPVIYLPNGQVAKGYQEPEGSAFRISSPSPNIILNRQRLKGAEPKAWDHELYIEMYKKHPTVFAAINKIVKTCTNTGFDFVPRNSRERSDDAEVTIASEFFRNQQDFVGELRRIYRDLLIFGDAYLYIVPNRRREPTKLKRLAPWTIHIKAKDNGKVQLYAQHDLTDPQSDTVIFRPHEILHFRIDDPSNDLYGLSPLESLKSTITADLHMLNFQKNFFKNGAALGTYIIVEEATDAEVDRVVEWIKEEYVGSDNAYKPVVLSGKGVDVKGSVTSHEEMSFLEGRNFFIEEILSVLDVPPAKIGRMETANRSNAKEQDKSFRTESIAPLQYTVEAILNDKFMRPILGLEQIIFEHSKSDVRDAQEQMELWKDAVGIGLLTINEVRNKMGYADVDGGEIPFVMTPTGAIPVDRFDLFWQLPALNTDEVPVTSRSPVEGDDRQREVSNIESGLKPTSKSMALNEAVYGMIATLEKADENRDNLISCYAYCQDAADESDHPTVMQIRDNIKKAVKTDDEDLQQAYIERAKKLGQLVLNPTVDE